MDNGNKKRGRPPKVKDYNSSFAKQLRKLCEGRTQQEIADGAGITRQNLGKFLLGETKPDVDTLEKLANFFNISTDYLLGRTDILTPDNKQKFVCDYTGLHEQAITRICTMKNYCMDYDGTQVSGTAAFEALNEYLRSFASEEVSVYIAKMKEINEDYLILCLIQRIHKDDRHKCSGNIPIDMACFDHKKLSNDIKEKSEKCDMGYFRASKAYENFLTQYHCNTIGYYDIKDIYKRLYDTFGYTKEQVDEKVKTVWEEYDKRGYKQWQQ